jgi:KipI family sensor histidine kinase inhibitor
MSTDFLSEPRFRISGDRGLLVELGESIDLETNRHTRLVASRLEGLKLEGILEVVPAYCSFLVIYQPESIHAERLQEEILGCSRQTDGHEPDASSRTVDIPVCYGGDFGPDIGTVAETNGLSEEEVIRIHAASEYPIYMMGFAPGFPYLGGLDERLHTPRLETPRSAVPAGSVGIAGSQTGIYPLTSPGGWQLIGRTPLRLFVPEQENPVPYYEPGDRLRFVPISEEEYQRQLREQGHG